MSREEFLEIANFNLGVFSEKADISMFIKQAISDMRKLEKIEDALGRDCLSDDMEKCNFDGLCDAHTVSVIEHILRGE